jgi:transcription factor SFP1
MEKEKPYKCECCGKRYKNLNGLKYVRCPPLKAPRYNILTNTSKHKQHSPPCNPELKPNGHLQAAGLGGGLGVNVAGLPGIGEEGLM